MNFTADIGSFAGGLVNAVAGIGSARRQYKYQSKLMEQQAKLQYQYGQMAADAEAKRNREAFDYEAAYNTAAKQRQRLEDAGLLGASLFEGAAPGTPAMTAPGTPGMSVSPGQGVDPLASIGSSIQQAFMGAAQIENIKSDTNKNNAQAERDRSQSSLNAAIEDLRRSEALTDKQKRIGIRIANKIAAATMATSIDQVRANLSKTQHEIDLISETRRKTSAEADSASVDAAYRDQFLQSSIAQMQASTTEALVHAMELQSLIKVNDAYYQNLLEMARGSYLDNVMSSYWVDAYKGLSKEMREAVIAELKTAGLSYDLASIDKEVRSLELFLKGLEADFVDPKNYNLTREDRRQMYIGANHLSQLSPLINMVIMATALRGGRGATPAMRGGASQPNGGWMY